MKKEKRNLFVSVNYHVAETDDFTSDKYDYWINTDKDLKVGDLVIFKDTDVRFDDLKLARIAYVEEAQSGKTYAKARTKALIGIADCSDYFDRKIKARRAKEIKEQLEARFKEAEKMALYRKLAESDETMMKLLNELDELEPQAEKEEEDTLDESW